MTTTTSPRGTPGTRSGAPHGIERVAGTAGLLVPAACAVAAYATAVDGPNLRQGAFPWAAAAGCVLAALTTIGVGRRHDRAWGRGRRLVAWCTAGALAAVAAFFVVVGGEDLLNRTLGTARIISDNELVTAVGTLGASLLTVVAVPAGLVAVGVAAVRTGVLGRSGRAAMLVVGPVLVLGALVTAATEVAWVSAAWPLLLGGCWAVVGISLLHEGSVR